MPLLSAISPKRIVQCQEYAKIICSSTSYELWPNEIVSDTEIRRNKNVKVIMKVQKYAFIYRVWKYSFPRNKCPIYQYTIYRFGGSTVVNQKKRKSVFTIEEKLATVEWNLKLLKTSAEITRTPLRTLKSMIRVSVIAPTRSFLQEIVDSHLR